MKPQIALLTVLAVPPGLARDSVEVTKLTPDGPPPASSDAATGTSGDHAFLGPFGPVVEILGQPGENNGEGGVVVLLHDPGFALFPAAYVFVPHPDPVAGGAFGQDVEILNVIFLAGKVRFAAAADDSGTGGPKDYLFELDLATGVVTHLDTYCPPPESDPTTFGSSTASSEDGTVITIGDAKARKLHVLKEQGGVLGEIEVLIGDALDGLLGADTAMSPDGSILIASAPLGTDVTSGQDFTGKVNVYRDTGGGFQKLGTITPPGLGFLAAFGVDLSKLMVDTSADSPLITFLANVGLEDAAYAIQAQVDPFQIVGMHRIDAPATAASSSTSNDFGLGLALAPLAPGSSLFRAAISEPLTGSGLVHVYEGPADALQWVETLQASDGELGDGFGTSLALDGDLLLVGSPGDDDVAPDAGAGYLFDLSGGSFFQQFGPGCNPLGGPVPGLDLAGSATPAKEVRFRIEDAPPQTPAFLFFGLDQAALPLPNGCELLLAALVPTPLGPFPTDAAGALELEFVIPATGLAKVTAQALLLLDPATGEFATTNGVQLTFNT